MRRADLVSGKTASLAKRPLLFLPALVIAVGCAGTQPLFPQTALAIHKCAPYQPILDPGTTPPRLVREETLRVVDVARLPYACVTFTVNADGIVEDVRVAATDDERTAAAFARTLATGVWEPAQNTGGPVAVRLMRVFAVKATSLQTKSSTPSPDIHWYLFEDMPRR